MTEPCAAYIEIGGALTPNARTDLAGAIYDDRAGFQWGDGCTEDEALAAIDEAIAKGETLTVYDSEANYGNIPGVQDVCEEHGLHWRHHYDGSYEWSGTTAVSKGKDLIAEVDSDNGGELLIALDAIKEAYARGLEAVAALIVDAEPARAPLPPLTLVAEKEDAA